MKLLFLAVCVSLNVLFSAGQDEGTTDSTYEEFIKEYWSSTTSTTEENFIDERPQNEIDEAHKVAQEKAGCQCVEYYQCDKNNNTNTNGEFLIDIRLGQKGGDKEEEDKFICDDYFQTCCKGEDVDLTIKEPPIKVQPIEVTTIDYQHSTPPPIHVEHPGCGHRNQDGVGFRITGDTNNEAQFGEFPWMIAVLKEEPCNCDTTHMLNVYQCGGSLISPKVVLTGAHCVYQKSPSSLKVRAGEWDTQTKKELFPHHDRRVQDIIFHEDYYAGALHNDVALLILDEPFEYKENVNVACLPEQDAEFDEHECFATGWGKDVFGKQGKYQVILKKVELPIVDRHSCQNALRRTRLGQHFKLHDSFICAGGEKGKDTCKGDGGSPLVCPIRSKPGVYAQVGMVAWGIGCGEDGTPGVYVNVPKFRHWIDDRLHELNLDTSAYNYS